MTGKVFDSSSKMHAKLIIRSGIIASVITFPTFKGFVGHPNNYDSLSGAVVSSFTGGCFLGAALAGWCVYVLLERPT